MEKDRFVVATDTGKLFIGRDRQFSSTANTSITAPGVLTPNCVFAEGGAEVAGNNKKLFFFTGGATLPYVLHGDSTAFTVISHPAADWTSSGTYPKFGLVHRNQLWAFAGQISYASDTSDHENFINTTTTLVEPVYPGEGGELRGAGVFKGRLFCFKDGGFGYMLNDTDTNSTNWYWQKIASNFGLAAPNAIAEALDDMIVGNTAGTLTSYAASQKLGSVEAADLVRNMQCESYLRTSTSKSGVPYEHVLYYEEKKLLFQTRRSAYYTYNDSLFVVDFGKANPRPALWVKGSPQCLAKWKDVNQVERPMYGDKDGFLNLMDWEDRTEGTAAYTGAFQTPHLDFSFAAPQLGSSEKHFDFLAVHYLPESSGNLSCDYYIDGRYVDTITFPMIQNQRPELDTFLLDTDRLVQPTTETSIQKLYGSGRTFSAYFYQAGSNQSFQIPAITVYFRAGSDKAMQT